MKHQVTPFSIHIGQTTVRLYTDISDLKNVILFALPIKNIDRQNTADIFIYYAPDKTVDELTQNYSQTFEFEDGIRYIYDSLHQTYHIYVQKWAYGLIDCIKARVEWFVNIRTLPRAALHTLVLDPLSLLLPNQNILICHAAAIAQKNDATLLFGYSGTGKSTLSYLLSHARPDSAFYILCDDTVILDFNAECNAVFPIQTGFGLPADTIDEYNLPLEKENILQHHRKKVYLRSLPNQAYGKHNITQLIFLEQGQEEHEHTHIRLLSQVDALKYLIASQTHIANPYMIARLLLYQRLAQNSIALHVRYSGYCDPLFLYQTITEGDWEHTGSL